MVSEPWVLVHRDAPDTELEAAEAATHNYPRVALQVLRYLVETGGDYDAHGADATGMWLNSYAPARNALMRRGFVEDSGDRVLNPRGRRCIVWTATTRGRVAATTGVLEEEE